MVPMRVLLLNQAFYPDVVSTAQHLSGLAKALADAGHQVVVVTSRRAYDQPERTFRAREYWHSVQIYRVWNTAFGKGARWRRAADFASFILSCCLRLVFVGRVDVVVALTSPPLISVIGAIYAWLWGARFCYWVMDMNPDEAMAAGWLDPHSLPGRVLQWLSRFSFARADAVIALDRFMKERILAKGVAPSKVHVVPPWTLDEHVRFDPCGRAEFRAEHRLSDRFVVMYSGNHSPVHPLDTLLNAALQLSGNPEIVFCFVGGGSLWHRIRPLSGLRQCTRLDGPTAGVEPSSTPPPGQGPNGGQNGTGDWQCLKEPPGNILCIPYQPLEKLAASLSAADVHVVVMGNPFVGIVHPNKIYNILRVAAPVLYIGPRTSHITDVLASLPPDYPASAVEHGDVAGTVTAILDLKRRSQTWSRQAPLRLLAYYSASTVVPTMVRIITGNHPVQSQG